MSLFVLCHDLRAIVQGIHNFPSVMLIRVPFPSDQALKLCLLRRHLDVVMFDNLFHNKLMFSGQYWYWWSLELVVTGIGGHCNWRRPWGLPFDVMSQQGDMKHIMHPEFVW